MYFAIERIFYSWEHINESKVLHMYVLEEFLTGFCTCLTKYFWKNSFNDLYPGSLRFFLYLLSPNRSTFRRQCLNRCCISLLKRIGHKSHLHESSRAHWGSGYWSISTQKVSKVAFLMTYKSLNDVFQKDLVFC